MPAPLWVALGDTIRTYRTERGYSQEAFADAIGVHRTYMSRVERGITNVTLANLERIADGLGVAVSDLFAQAERRTPSRLRSASAHRAR